VAFNFNKEKQPSIREISDEELVAKITQVMWQARRASKSEMWMAELKMCHDEVTQRGKMHLWNRAKDCLC
jgi:hypothetical protein